MTLLLSNLQRLRVIPCCLIMWNWALEWAVPPALHAIPQPPLRAAYEFQFGKAWSSGVELPRYAILDLGRDLLPLAVNDGGTVLLRDPAGRLLRRTWGRTDVLKDSVDVDEKVLINERDTVVANDYSTELQPRVLYWFGAQDTARQLDLSAHMIETPHYNRLYALNDLDQLVLRSDAMNVWTFVPPELFHIETNLVELGTGAVTEWAHYEYSTSADFVLTQGGSVYEVYGLNNYTESTGLVYEDAATSSADDPDPVYSYQNQYYTIDMDTVLSFEPLCINDARTILGCTPGPLYGMVVSDAFGERHLGPVLDELRDTRPAMSNPADRLEEIVVGRHYFRRMTERNLFGQPTSQPAPDFWQGEISDLVPDTGPFQSLEATAISAGGRIAGTAWRFDPGTGSFGRHAILLVAPALLPDWNRDGKIDTWDDGFRHRADNWRFWINDDDDSGDLARSHADDLPASRSPDWASPGVDGLRDGVDFFPVLIDLQKVLVSIGDLSGLEIVLKQADGALAMTPSSLLPEEAGLIHSQRLADGFGPGLDEPFESATTLQIPPEGVRLGGAFLHNIQRENRGVIFLEGRRASTEPLVMELVRDGSVQLTAALPLSISPVRDMLRIINLRDADPLFAAADPGPWPTSTSEPANLPDRWLESFIQPLRTLVHVHGFNWGGDEIPAAHAEIFKRLFQAGSSARFIGVTWYGDRGSSDLTGTSLAYNENVINAFLTAGIMAEALAPFAGPFTYAFAHSLGNMVTSSAIADHGLRVGRYLMINAAVPLEAYSGESPGRRDMVHPHWKDEFGLVPDYAERLLSPNWHRLFADDDHRSALKWKNRFTDGLAPVLCTNFYSSGEDILKTGNGDLPGLFGDIFEQELIWVFNEMIKGTSDSIAFLSTDIHGGWGFNRAYMEWVDPGGPAHPPAGDWERISPSRADLIDSAALVAEPFFFPFAAADSEFPAWGDSAWLYGGTGTANARLPALPLRGAARDHILNHAKILAEAIPGHSAPAGSQPVAVIVASENINMDALYRDPANWPSREPAEKRDRWLHSDYLNPALAHVIRLYRKCVQHIHYMP